MTSRGLYRLVLLMAAGGFVFQAGASCITQMGDTLATTLVPALSSALTTAITDASQGATATSGLISPPTGGPFSAVNDAIQGIQSNLGLSGATASATSSSGTGQQSQ
jgi:hypothetical protein